MAEKTFVIQGEYKTDALGLPLLLPAHSYGYTVIESADYQNRQSGENLYNYVLNTNMAFKGSGIGISAGKNFNYLTKDHIPVGSAEYVMGWLRLMGAKKIKPMNIPEELWGFVKREVARDAQGHCKGRWYVNSADRFKDPRNGIYENGGIDVFVVEKTFMTKYVDSIISEWRVFVFDKEICGIRCYFGDEFALPDKAYLESIVEAHKKHCYVLDVMVYTDEGGAMVTDIVEVRSFFACDLYGFNDHRRIPQMLECAINELLT